MVALLGKATHNGHLFDGAPGALLSMPVSPWTPEERALLQRYQQLSRQRRHWLHRWVVEVVPPLLFVGLWAFTGQVVFLLALLAVLVGFNLLRVWQQQRSVARLGALAARVLAMSAASHTSPTEAGRDGKAQVDTDTDVGGVAGAPR